VSQNKLAQQAIDELNEQLKTYETLSPFGNLYSIKDLKLSKSDIKSFEDSDDIINDSLQAYAAIETIQHKISTLINIVFILKSTEDFDLTNKLYDEISYQKSEDDKLHNLVLYAKSGGSYQSRLSIIYYKENANYQKVYETYTDEGDGSLFHPDGYDSIKTLNTSTHIKYLLQGSVKTCGMCFYNYILLIHHNNKAFEVDFSYATNSRSYDTLLDYNDSNQTITVNYQTDDLSGPDCFCEQNNEENIAVLDENLNLEKECKCLFKFNGDTFVLKEESETVLKRN
tara:strand:- start:64977 stop:65828 length:852 start_codon:yes stop_codon:yes gene_type:complete